MKEDRTGFFKSASQGDRTKIDGQSPIIDYLCTERGGNKKKHMKILPGLVRGGG